MPVVVAIKLPSLISLWGIAFFSYKIVSEIHVNRWIRLLGFLLPLFTPTLLLNSAYWGQADCMYGVFLLGGVYFLIVKKELQAFVFLGLAFSLKFQTVFIFPLVAFLIIKKETSLRYILLIPLVYLLSLIPVLAIGQPITELLTLYFHQVTNMPGLVYNAPTVFAFIPPTGQEIFLARAGILVGVFSIVVLLIIGLIKTGDRSLSVRDIIQFGLLSSTVVVFCIPFIHERYYFIAELLAVVYAFCFPKQFYISFSIILISLFTYIKYLFGGFLVFTLPQLALCMLITICVLFYHYFFTLSKESVKEPVR
jgi:Gpi18-like mannosyltransferase